MHGRAGDAPLARDRHLDKKGFGVDVDPVVGGLIIAISQCLEVDGGLFRCCLGKYQAQGFEIIAVNLDTGRPEADKFLADNPASFTVALDPQATMPPQYGVKGMPTSYLIDGNGEIILQHTGFNDSHKADLEAAIQKALANQ